MRCQLYDIKANKSLQTIVETNSKFMFYINCTYIGILLVGRPNKWK